MSYHSTGQPDKQGRTTYTQGPYIPGNDDKDYSYSSTGNTDADGRPTYTRHYTPSFTPYQQNNQPPAGESGSGNPIVKLVYYAVVIIVIFWVLKFLGIS